MRSHDERWQQRRIKERRYQAAQKSHVERQRWQKMMERREKARTLQAAQESSHG